MRVGAAGELRAAVIAGTVIMTLTAPPARAQAAPLMVQTVPSLVGVELSMFGRAVTTDDHGLAVTTNAPGTYELSTPVSGAKGDVRWEFSGWSDGSDSPTRPVTVSSFTFLEAGYDVYHRAGISLLADGGEELPEPDTVTLVDDRGERVTLSGDEPVWLLARRAVETPGGFVAEEVGYRVLSTSAGGEPVPPSRAQRLVPVPGGLLEIEVTLAEGSGASLALPEPDSPPRGRGSGADESLWPFVVLGAAAVGLLALAAHSRAAAWARAGASALRAALPVLGRNLSSLGSGIAAGARRAGSHGRGTFRPAARRVSLLVVGASKSARSWGRPVTAAAADVPRWIATMRARAGRSWGAVRSRARLVAISVTAAAGSAARHAGAATAMGRRVAWTSARSAAHAVAARLRAFRMSAVLSATAAVTRRVVSPGVSARPRVRPARSEAERAAPGGRERELVRVTLHDGRVIEGWWERPRAGIGEDFFCLTHVSRVLEPDGTDTVSTPVDAFIPVGKIADIERAAARPGEGVKSLPRAEGAGRADRVSSPPA